MTSPRALNRIIGALTILLLAGSAWAQTAGALTPVPRLQFLDNAGVIVPGGKLCSYLAGTTTPQATYSDSALGVPNSNPIILNSAGRPSNGSAEVGVYLAAVNYKFLLLTAGTDSTCSTGTTLWTQDNVEDIGQIFLAQTRTANTVFAGPSSGAAAVPTFRALVAADIPAVVLGNHVCDVRLTASTGVPVPTTDVTAATSVFVAPYAGYQCDLYTGAAWKTDTFTQITIAVPASTNTNYDVFLLDNSGTINAETLAWSSDTARATALTTQDGVLVKTGATTRRYIGTFRTTGVSGQTEDSAAKRLVWNYYNRVTRTVQLFTATANWNYTTATIRQANASTTNQIAIVNGWPEDAVSITLMIAGVSNTNASACSAGIGYDTTTAFTGVVPQLTLQASSVQVSLTTPLTHVPAVGYHYYAWNEESAAAGTTTWIGVSGSVAQSGLTGLWRN